MDRIAGIDIAVWDVKAQALGIALYQALGAVRSSVGGMRMLDDHCGKRGRR
jgi:L-alanine-DL-glutamate epimerase-like enolase superfamily enzyme